VLGSYYGSTSPIPNSLNGYDSEREEKPMRVSNSPVPFLFTVILVSQAGSFDMAKDLSVVIALQGKPCGTVTSFEKLEENDYLAHCSSGDVYRVYVNDKGRVIVVKPE